MKTGRTANLLTTLLATVAAYAITASTVHGQPPADASQGGAAAAQAVPAEPAVLRDGDDAEFGRVDGMHQTRYIEVFLAGREAATGKLVAACYNPMFTTAGIPATRDAAPQALVKGIDFNQLKTEYALLGASLNGPKIWTPDWAEADIGKVRDFNGIKAAWVAQLDLKKEGNVADVTPYEPMTIARKSRLGWNKGTTVMILDDAQGNTWVLKGFQLGLEPKHSYQEFLAAGQSNFKNLPAGWKFRVKTLDSELIETPEDGALSIMADEFFNIYDKLTPGNSNYRP